MKENLSFYTPYIKIVGWVPGDWLFCIICLRQMINSTPTAGHVCCCCDSPKPFEWKLQRVWCSLLAALARIMLNSSWHNALCCVPYCSSVRSKGIISAIHMEISLQLHGFVFSFILFFQKFHLHNHNSASLFQNNCIFWVCPYFTTVSKMVACFHFFVSNEWVGSACEFWTGFKLEFYVVLVNPCVVTKCVKDQVVFLREMQFVLLSTAVTEFAWLGVQLIN